MRTFESVLAQLMSLLDLPASLESVGFRDESGVSVLKRNLDTARVVRNAEGNLPKLVLEYEKMDDGVNLHLYSEPFEDRFNYVSSVDQERVVPVVLRYLECVRVGRIFRDSH